MTQRFNGSNLAENDKSNPDSMTQNTQNYFLQVKMDKKMVNFEKNDQRRSSTFEEGTLVK